MKPENRNQLVRGVVTAGNHYSSQRDVVAYTYWYRHDDDLNRLENELDSLCRCYMNMSKTNHISFGYEYKDYVK